MLHSLGTPLQGCLFQESVLFLVPSGSKREKRGDDQSACTRSQNSLHAWGHDVRSGRVIGEHRTQKLKRRCAYIPNDEVSPVF
jgi:hypothetical protein